MIAGLEVGGSQAWPPSGAGHFGEATAVWQSQLSSLHHSVVAEAVEVAGYGNSNLLDAWTHEREHKL